MDLVLATIPKSTPTKTLEGVHNAMAEACKVVNVLQPGMSQIQAVLQQIEDYLAKAVGGLDIVDKILGAIKIALQVCKYLGKLIPYVGEALSQIAGYIEGMKIEDTIRKVLQRIKDLVEKVRSGVMKNIRTAIVTISSKVNKIAEELPRYVDTANIMAALFSLVDISIYGIFGTTTDGEIKKLIDTTLQGLEKLANGAKQGIDTLKTAFEPFTRFLEEIWKDVKENILGPINKGFGTIIDSLQPIFHWIKDVVSSCDTIKEWFQPFFWVLDKLEWIVKRTIGWLIDKAKSVFNLDRIFDWFKEKINELLEASGINAIYGEVEGMLQRGLQPCYDRLAELLAPIGDRLGIEQAYREFTKHLSAFQEDPAGHTAELLQKALLNGWDPTTPFTYKVEPVELPPGIRYWDDIKQDAERAPTEMIVDHTAALLVTEERSFAQFDKIKPINVPIGSSGRKRSWNDEDDQPVSRWKHVKRLAPSATVTNPAQERATIQEEIATRLDSIDALIWSTGFDRAVDNQKLSDTKGSDTLERDLNSSDFSASNSNSALLNSATSHVTVPYELFEMRISGEQATREPTERTVAPVRLDYIMLNDISVSVLLRTQHRRVVSQIPVTSDSLPEWPLFEASHTHTDLLVVQPDSSTIAGMNSKNELKEQDTGYLKFCSKLEVLRSASHQALESLEWMQGVAYKADAVFSSYDSDSAAFCDHFSAILGTLQTITEGISELTKLPLSYKTALTEKLATYIAPEFVDPVFSFLEKVLQAIKNFKANIGGVQTSTNAMYAAYKTFQNHAATICSEKPFETYGYEVTSISSFIRAVKSRIDTSLGTYTNLEKMGASYLQKLDESTNQQNMSMPVQGLDQDISTCRLQLDETFMSIIGDVERSIQAVEKLPDKLHAVHRTLSVVHDDVRLFGGAVTAISLQCKQVEEKVVAVDMLRVHAERICSAIKPFEQVLARFGIQKDPLWTSDTVDIRASSTAAPVPIQSEDISIVTQFIQLLTSHLPKLAFAGLDLVLDHHLDLTRTRMNLERITEGLALTDRQSLEGNLKAYMQTLGELTATAQPEHSITLGQDQEELDVPSEFRNALSVIDLDHLQMFNAVQEKLSKIQEGFPRSSTSAQFPSEPTVDSKADSIVPPGNTEASSIAKDGSCLPDAIAR